MDEGGKIIATRFNTEQWNFPDFRSYLWASQILSFSILRILREYFSRRDLVEKSVLSLMGLMRTFEKKERDRK